MSSSFDHVGLLTRCVEDAASALQATAGHDAADPTSAPAAVPDFRSKLGHDLRGLRIGLIRHFYEQDVPTDPQVGTAMAETVQVLRSLGATVVDTTLTHVRAYHACFMTVVLAEAYAYQEANLRDRWSDYGPFARHRFAVGAFIPASDYIRATQARRRLADEVEMAVADCDLLATATAVGPAPPAGTLRKDDLLVSPELTSPFNVSGQPAITVPCGVSTDGLPLGLQLAGRSFDEPTLLAAAHAYERATPWHKRWPAL